MYFVADIYQQRRFTYTGTETQLSWDECGIKINFPSCTATVHIEVTVSVLSTDNNFLLPDGSELTSAVYDISADKPFLKPLTIQIQHCVPLNDAPPTGMSFAIANTQQGAPYTFRPLEGVFRCGSSYGEVQCTHFSIFTIISTIKWWLGQAISFAASIHYFKDGYARFAVTKNLQVHINVSFIPSTDTYMYVCYCYTVSCTTQTLSRRL